MSFTNGEPFVATERHCNAKWGVCCCLCKNMFKVGDTVRWQYLGDVGYGNILVCEKCDGTKEELLAKSQFLFGKRDPGWMLPKTFKRRVLEEVDAVEMAARKHGCWKESFINIRARIEGMEL